MLTRELGNEIMEQQQLLQTRIFSVQKVTYETIRGDLLERDIIRHPGSVAIVPVLDDGRICLIKNFRIAVAATLIEIPAGTLEPNESPLACAERELLEETGYRALEIEKLTSFYPAPGILDELMHLFVARRLSAGDPARELGEQIENYIVSPQEAQSMIADGQICDAKTIVGLMLVAQG